MSAYGEICVRYFLYGIARQAIIASEGLPGYMEELYIILAYLILAYLCLYTSTLVGLFNFQAVARNILGHFRMDLTLRNNKLKPKSGFLIKKHV